MVSNFCKGLAWFLLGGILVIVPVTAQNADPAPAKKPLALAAGVPIYEGDLTPLIQPQLGPLRKQEYELKSKALERLVNQKLLEAEAGKKGIPVENLLTQEVDEKIPEATEAELQGFYWGQRDRLNRPFEEVKTALQQALKQVKIQLAREDYVKRLREQGEVAIFLRPPKVQVSYDPQRLRGSSKAEVVLVEFSDFQCPFCRAAHATLQNLLAKYEGKVSLAYRDFPLRGIHAQAQSAAEASRCAGEQGKFWEYHDSLFANPNMEREGLLDHARALKLDETQFDSCLTSGKYKPQVERDIEEGTRAGVSGTPGFFINGIFLGGAQPAAAFEKIIEEELAALKLKPRE